MSMDKCYIASGWFSPEWLEELEMIKTKLDNCGLEYFSPKDENLCSPDSTVNFQDEVFNGNIQGMEDCDWMICNTRNKDMGSIFEAGYMNSLGKPIVYFCDGLPPGAQFNLMLAASGVKVCRSLEELDDYVKRCVLEDALLIERYEGEIE